MRYLIIPQHFLSLIPDCLPSLSHWVVGIRTNLEILNASPPIFLLRRQPPLKMSTIENHGGNRHSCSIYACSVSAVVETQRISLTLLMKQHHLTHSVVPSSNLASIRFAGNASKAQKKPSVTFNQSETPVSI